jgi:hypothetical protein
MALDIDRFSPPKESSWRRVDVFGASCAYQPLFLFGPLPGSCRNQQ